MNNSTRLTLTSKAIELLKELIATPSFSKEEEDTGNALIRMLEKYNVPAKRLMNNIYAQNLHFNPSKPTLLLNSHHDTVKPNKGYTRDPFSPTVEDGILYGLGSNDAGGCLVALLATFLHFYPEKELNYNLVFAASAEEEISGTNGIEALLPHLGTINFGIVGEPTKMQMAVAERGLMVLDVTANGKAGHAARDEGENAIYNALEDIRWFEQYQFPRLSELLGKSRMTVTVISTENKAHNVIPSSCSFVVDCRINELYSFEEVLEIIQSSVKSTVVPRSTRLRSTSISLEHPIVLLGQNLGLTYYGSPTTSDKALMPFPTLKIGPGDSARSHTANEFIYLSEIEEGINTYINLLTPLLLKQ